MLDLSRNAIGAIEESRKLRGISIADLARRIGVDGRTTRDIDATMRGHDMKVDF